MKEKKGEKNLVHPSLLLVEDDDVTVNVIKRILQDIYVVDCANNGTEALKLARENNYSAFLIDIGLPGKMDGIQTTKELKEIKDNKNKPYIAITAYAMAIDRQNILTGGLTHYITKPFQFQELINLIDNALKN
jgi:CheY-like chemotaxis protein